VAKKSPGNIAVLELIDRDFSSESTVGLVEDILGCDLKTRLKMLPSKEKVECWRSNNDLYYETTRLADVRSRSDSFDSRGSSEGAVMFGRQVRGKSKVAEDFTNPY
jgi:hypothetical protein